jgi:hypothetical protein
MLHQDVYPYAKPYPVAYMPRGGKVYGSLVGGGWFTGGPKLKKALAAVGVPAQPPTSHQATTPSTGSDSGRSTGAIAAIAAGIFATLALAVVATIRKHGPHRRTAF